jgi:hypothetical protein
MKRLLILVLAVVAAGCAKFPSGAGQGNSTRIVFTMTTATPLDSHLIYRVAMRFSLQSDPTDSGPLPIAAFPWGNGYVAGNATNYVDWQPLLYPPNGYGLFAFRNCDTNQVCDLNAPAQIGVPVVSTPVPVDGFGNPTGNKISFAIDLSQLGLTPADLVTLQTNGTMQVNFLTMDIAPTGNDPRTKHWDAIGDENNPSSINIFLSIPLNVSHTYTNANYFDPLAHEPQGDESFDPAIDITDWSIDVQKP